MNRVDAELGLLRCWFGASLDFEPAEQWVRLRDYRVPADLWRPTMLEIAFQIPMDMAANPYGFSARGNDGSVTGGFQPTGGSTIGNYTYPSQTPWGGEFGRFSWQLIEWLPADPIEAGSTVLDFARSIADRFREGA